MVIKGKNMVLCRNDIEQEFVRGKDNSKMNVMYRMKKDDNNQLLCISNGKKWL